MSIEDDVTLLERVPTLRLLGSASLRMLAIGSELRNFGDGDVHLGVRVIEQAFVHGTGDEPAQADVGGRKPDGAGFQAREIEQVLDEAVEPLDPPVHRPQELRRRLADAVDQVLQSRFQAGDRGAQLVGDVGHQIAALPVGQREVMVFSRV